VEQVMLSYGDMIRFMGSIRGMDISLAVAGGITEAEVENIGSVRERIKLAGDLMDRMIGEFSGESDEEPSPPLAETVPTGG
jgi:3-keto-L-gulonate-6-phosphate decarboxylase